jgi:hypothetical protein
MDRSFLVLLLLTTVHAGCGRQELPVTVRLHDEFTEREAALIVEAIDQVNLSLGKNLYGEDVIVYAGRIADEDGFTIEDFGDDTHVIYRVPTAPDYLLDTAEEQGYIELGGYGTIEDVLIFADVALARRWTRTRKKEFRHLLLHEFGHFLGMMHSDDPHAIMVPRGDTTVTDYTDEDKRNFCIIYDCAMRPP